MTKNIYVSIILRDELGAFLTQHHHNRPSKPWRFPGGKPEPGETLIAACAREAKEELGVEVLALRYIASDTVVADGAEWRGHFFLCESYIGQPSVKEGGKHDALKYMRLAELLANEVFPEFGIACDIATGLCKGIVSVDEL